MTKYDHPPVLSIGLYVLLVFLVPYAKTSEQRAGAAYFSWFSIAGIFRICPGRISSGSLN